MKQLSIALLLSCSFIFLVPAQAEETVYVSDVLYVPMRSGAGVEYRIIKAALKSGTKLTRAESTEDGTWARVTNAEGEEGWIRNQYLTPDMTSQLRLNFAESKLARLEKTNATLSNENKKLKSEIAGLSSESRKVSQARTRISKELDSLKQLSAGAVELDRNYQELLQKHEVTQTQRDSLMAENEQLKNDKSLTFMLYGVGILILGMILAVVVPALKPNKGYSEWR